MSEGWAWRYADDPRLRHVEEIPARPAQTSPWPQWARSDVVAALEQAGIREPWTHQADAADLAHRGRHVVLATGTASGKSLAYLLPSLTDILDSRGPKEQRGASVLYVAPTKALAHDQFARVRALGGVRAATHDGDASQEERYWTRDFAEYVLTNPDMLHFSMLPRHERWSGFFSRLRYVVVDEMHHYRGIFGAHTALVLRRLRRICEHHGASPTFILTSATLSDPADAARRLTGLECAPITEDHSPSGPRSIGLWEPPLLDDGNARRPALREVADLLTDFVIDGTRTLAFAGSRRGVETVALRSRRALEEVSPGLGKQVAAYRGGYLPEERRALESDLRQRRLTALATTTALELGVDISGLDAVVLNGFPGTRAGFWQQVGRAGRGETAATAVMVAREDPLDHYLVNHPEVLFGQPVEAFIFDPQNPYVLGPHLCAAASEIPLTTEGPASAAIFGGAAWAQLDHLVEAGLLRRRPRGWFWTSTESASRLADLRSTGGPPVRLIEPITGTVIGTVDQSSAPAVVHAGAVYLHQGETWVVDELDLDESVALLNRNDPGYNTSARTTTDIEITGMSAQRSFGESTLHVGTVRVTDQVTSFLKKDPSGSVLGEYLLDLPERSLETSAVWWTLSDDVVARVAATHPDVDLAGAAHAAEHASIGLLPLIAICDRWDIGGVSTLRHPDTGVLTVFVYDGRAGGAGLSARGFEAAETWFAATLDAVASCACLSGCPSCVQSPKCGNQNEPLDKAGAIALLGLLTQDLRAPPPAG